jgi:hypothetical protein
VDEGTKLPVSAVLVTIVDDAGVEVLPGVRSDSLGNFIVHAARAGTWRVKAIRIGYSPVTSDPVPLGVGGLAVVRLRMTTVAQQLVPVVVIEKRQLNASELMSASGFDLRESRGFGRFLSGERLAAIGKDNVQEILGTYFQPTLYVYNDSVLGDILHIRQGASECEPEIYLDGRLLATAPEPGAVFETTPPRTRLDSMRAQTRAQTERMRVGFGQVSALTQLSALTADALHGIEVYRANEVPPPSLGAWFGMTKASIRACGTVAVWTKRGAQSLVAARRTSPADSRAIQVISGTLIDFDTGMPLAKRAVSLLNEGRDPVGSVVMTDDNGDFTIRTGRAGDLRLMAGGNEYLTSTTPPFHLSANEMIVVKLFVSTTTGVLAPLGVAARLVPQNIGVASLAGFTYRRERAVGGTFIRGSDITASGARSLADVVRSIPGVSISDTPAPRTIAVAREGRAPCAPAFYVDGVRLGEDPRSTIDGLRFDRLFGVEVYTRESDVPSIFADGAPCAAIVIWTNR